MARTGNRHCVNCIGTLSFPIVHLSLYSSIWIRYKIFYTPLRFYIYTEMQNVIELSPTLAKLCYTNHDLQVNFFNISLRKREKSRYLCIGMTDLHKIWHNDAEWVSQVDGPAVKNLVEEIQNGRRPLRLSDPFCVIMRYRDSKMATSWIAELKLKR